MSIKNYDKVIYIMDPYTNCVIDTIHDYYKYKEDIQKLIIFRRLEEILENNTEILIKYGRKV